MPRKSRGTGNRREWCSGRTEPREGDEYWKHIYLFFFLNDKNFPSFYWPKNDLIFLLKKNSQSAPHLAWVAPHLRERQPRSMKLVLIISRSSPLEHFVIWTFLRKTEVMSCWEFILQTSTIPQIPSRLLLLRGRSFQNGSSHWISAERTLLQ